MTFCIQAIGKLCFRAVSNACEKTAEYRKCCVFFCAAAFHKKEKGGHEEPPLFEL